MHGCKKMCVLHWIAALLLFIGGLNLGLDGLFQWNLLETLLGSWEIVLRIVYVLIGLAALSMLLMGKCKGCGGHGAKKSCCGGDDKMEEKPADKPEEGGEEGM